MKKGLLFLFSTFILFSCTKDEDRVVEDQSRINELIAQIDQLRSENQSLDNMITSLQSEINRLLLQMEEEASSTDIFTEMDGAMCQKLFCLMLATMERELLEHFIDMQALFLPILTETETI